MNKFQISTLATAWRESCKTTDEELLASIDGLSSDESFSEYIIDSGDPRITNLNIQSGRLEFHYDSNSKELLATVSYDVELHLTSEESEAQVKYTLGQLSDGIGENLVSDYIDKKGVVIDPVVNSNQVIVRYLN